MSRQLRPYQLEAVEAVYQQWVDGQRTVVVLPTGTGKSTVIARIATDAVDHGQQVLMVAHRRELLDQMVANVHAVDPTKANATGYVQAERDEYDAPIVAGSFQTLVNPGRLASLGRRDVVLVDEVHHSPAETYAGVLEALVANHGTRFLAGFTATLKRTDGGLGDMWDTVAYERSLAWALEEGYLVPPVGKTVVLPDLDTTTLTVRAGDYATGELSKAMVASVETTVDAIKTHAAGRRMLVFGATVEHCEALAVTMSREGIPTAMVVGSTSSDERAECFEDFTAGRLEALVTVQVLTEGTDLPACDCVVLARPTRSPVLFTQMVGRALRLLPGKETALVLDLAGSTRDVAVVTLSDLSPTSETKRVSPTSDEDPGQVEPAKPARVQREGPVDMVDVDILDGSNAVWLSTSSTDPAVDGVPFLDGGNGVFAYVLPAGEGLYVVGVLPGKFRRETYVLDTGGPVTWPVAREAAEVEVSRLGALVEKSAPWRSRPTPTDGQVEYAKSLGIPHAELKNKARLSDDISVVIGTRRLNHLINPT